MGSFSGQGKIKLAISNFNFIPISNEIDQGGLANQPIKKWWPNFLSITFTNEVIADQHWHIKSWIFMPVTMATKAYWACHSILKWSWAQPGYVCQVSWFLHKTHTFAKKYHYPPHYSCSSCFQRTTPKYYT